ncbi:MAG: metalloregulator ArsR/SmtB family transcription factor [Desulfuromonadales bacterium]|nr:metalloregulator ArsR/SmtB family transcription factor [Desulfuromonadales bacterium]
MVLLFKALGDPLRLRLLNLLCRGELTVQDLTVILGLGQSKISHHLKILCAAGILAVKPQGTWNYYRVMEENLLFRTIWPEIRTRFEAWPEQGADLLALGAFREQRRRQNLEFFETHARNWDDLAEAILPTPDYLPFLLNQIPPDLDVAELGVGTGGLLLELTTRCRRLVGIDHSSAMLTETRRRLAAAGQESDLRLGELTHLPLADSELDTVLMNMVLHHLQHPAGVMHEVHRVLKPGGAIIIADLHRHQHDAVRSTMADVWLGFEEQELTTWLMEAGFTVDRVEKFHGRPGDYTVLVIVARATRQISL